MQGQNNQKEKERGRYVTSSKEEACGKISNGTASWPNLASLPAPPKEHLRSSQGQGKSHYAERVFP
jgi:hypothetical protein